MGWNSWYDHGPYIDENLIRSTADAIATNGLKDAGFEAMMFHDDDVVPDIDTKSEIQIINYFFVRATLTNQLADPSGLKGVSLGPIGSTVGSATRTWPVESAQENFRLSQGRFDAGVGTIIELTDAQLALTQAQNTEAQGLADYRIAVVRLERAVGQR